MVQFLVKRLIGLLFIVLGVTFITFILGYLAPGDPIKEMMGNRFDVHIWLMLRHDYGLDLPWYQQYFQFLGRLAHFDLGTSFHPQQRAVWDILKDGVPISVELGVWGTLLTLLVGIPVGIWSALKANTWFDTLNMGIALIFFALPGFILAVFVQIFLLWLNNFGINWPVTGGVLPGNMIGVIYNIKLSPLLPTQQQAMGIMHSWLVQRCWKCCARTIYAQPMRRDCWNVGLSTSMHCATPSFLLSL